ncbi:MAG TPA: glycoside hydrolase family 2 TIM barrel-domain containing protein [Chitinophaga sp.]|uniref:glycoside hydrolase family 2 protein n=1 Tax=Chitinophaga sp. TaxID=1869181 RepID=UPI002BD7FF81|nr:glycoside hydrolase family 2 TIM barrel-domain containing protein [Chitinophaga sp.]HVI45015.1 glycoside hydrolase family 2 TIM barrel-domain containing protein [Chitinophaga sp.]
MKRLSIFSVLLLLLLKAYSQEGRKVIPFNEGWLFRKGAPVNDKSIPDTGWGAVNIPHTWNNKDMQEGKNFYAGEAGYRKTFRVDENLKGKRLFLRFEGVGSVAGLYVNNRFIGEHKGAYAAFCFEITHVVQYGADNTLLLKADNTPRPDIIPVNNFLFGVFGGMYRPVSLIITNDINITTTDYASPGIYISQDDVSEKEATVTVMAKIENKRAHHTDASIQTVIKDRGGKRVAVSVKKVSLSPQGINIIRAQLAVDNPHLWNGLKDPYLYSLTTSVIVDGQETDAVTQPLGLRHFEVVAGRGCFLNGKAYTMHGVTRHQEWQDYGSALSNAQHKADLDLIREMGATTIRFAHYQQAAYMYAQCDSTGLLAWAEIPFVNNSTGKEGDNARQQLTELIRQNYNHPSIYVWGVHNEVYSKTADEHVAVLTRQLNDIAKTEDPGRYSVSVSGYGEMNRPANLAADIQGMNRYFGWYEGRIGDIQQWVESLEKNYPDYKLMLTEYGADGNIDQHTDSLITDFDPVSGQFFPETYQTATHVKQWAVIEQHPYITASYLWNTFEFAVPMWNRGGVNARNLKGLITYDRKQKKDAFFWYKANWNPAPMIYIAERRNNMRTRAAVKVEVFSNMQQVTLSVNGSKPVTGHNGANAKDIIFENVVLKSGANILKATGVHNGKVLTDTVTWHLQPVK